MKRSTLGLRATQQQQRQQQQYSRFVATKILRERASGVPQILCKFVRTYDTTYDALCCQLTDSLRTRIYFGG